MMIEHADTVEEKLQSWVERLGEVKSRTTVTIRISCCRVAIYTHAECVDGSGGCERKPALDINGEREQPNPAESDGKSSHPSGRIQFHWE